MPSFPFSPVMNAPSQILVYNFGRPPLKDVEGIIPYYIAAYKKERKNGAKELNVPISVNT